MTQKQLLKQIITPELHKLFEILAPDECRLVGGLVRDYLLGQVSSDVDICTTAEPTVVIEKLTKAGIKTIPTGIKHGTITVVMNHHTFEVTTLRKDIQTDGRHAVVAFTDSFEEDAARRDFTFNALYMDLDGNITDYFKGKEDLETLTVRFIGNAESRIDEDYLRILRYFRFFARFNSTYCPEDVKQVMSDKARLVATLSVERITDEVLKILTTRNPSVAWKIMDDIGLLEQLGLHPADHASLNDLAILFPEERNPLVRIGALYNEKGKVFVTRDPKLRFSNSQSKFLKSLMKALNNIPHYTAPEHLAYRLGKDVAAAAFEIDAARSGSTDTRHDCLQASKVVKDFKTPDFPIKGADLINKGVPAGEKVGQILTEVEEWWIEEDFPGKSSCLKHLEEVISKN